MGIFKNKKVRQELPPAADKKFKRKQKGGSPVDQTIKDPFENPMKIMDAFDDFEQNDYGKVTSKSLFGGVDTSFEGKPATTKGIGFEGIADVYGITPKTENAKLKKKAKKSKTDFEGKSNEFDFFGGVPTF